MISNSLALRRLGLLAKDFFHIWNFNFGKFFPIFILEFVLLKVFRIIANSFENLETWGCSCVCVYVEGVSSLDLLEKSHRRKSLVILHHGLVRLSYFHVFGWVLENASSAIRAFAWVFQEILTDRCEILPAESLFLLQFFLSMCESAPLFLELVLALEALQPEPTQFGLDLALPWVLLLWASLCWGFKRWLLLVCVLDGRLFSKVGLVWTLDKGVEWHAIFFVGVARACLRRMVGASCLVRLRFKKRLCLSKS